MISRQIFMLRLMAALVTSCSLWAAPALAQPANDACGNAIPIGLGDTPFSNLLATTDGFTLAPACDMGIVGDDNVHNDIWYSFTSPTTIEVTVSTCNNADFDTRLAVYDGPCPGFSFSAVTCNDDANGCGFTSELTFTAEAGVLYRIRVGSFSNAFEGSGTLTLSAAGNIELLCTDGVDNDSDGFTDCADPDCQFDTDSDGTFDCLDGCPNDPDKTAPGLCGCGVIELDTDSDGSCDAVDPDDDNDGILDGADPAPLNAFICGDSDGDTCDDCAVAGMFEPMNDGTDTDADGLCNVGDPDDDGDGVLDATDPAPLDAFVCGDSDGDSCDDCAVAGTFAPTNDGTDTDADGLCNVGDPDDDNDTILDGADPAPLDPLVCGDSDGDSCDDCAVAGTFAPTNDGTDTDADGLCNVGDPDDDNDTILDGADPAPLDPLVCGDSDGDTCDDCAVAGTYAPTNDGTDTDSDGLCNVGDPDDDGDGVLDAMDPSPFNAFVCGDSDGDTCDDCAVAGMFAPTNDGTDTDSDGLCNVGDPDDDGDGVLDAMDPSPFNAFVCGDSDGDSCDDCAVAGMFAPTNDGTDTDADGLCDVGDPDDDGDGIVDLSDPAPLDPFTCGDSDGDTCDDCVVAGTFAPLNDGPDGDMDGVCDAGDTNTDSDGDGVDDATDPEPGNAFICGDSDGDTCDDCAVAGMFAPTNDGTDTDGDGLCDAGDTDDDNDTILDGADPAPLDPFICGDSDGDTCDDCAVAGMSEPLNDGPDGDMDGVCDAGDTNTDSDGDGVDDATDPDPGNAFICGDSDGDTCDDCAVAGMFAPTNDGTDTDSDGLCNVGDPDDDGDGVLDAMDPSPFNAFVCGDSDGDSCDDCAVAGMFAPTNDGTDTDADGLCDVGDPDDDGDGIVDLSDPAPLDPFTCGDSDGDTCDDCVVAGTFAPLNDGPDGDMDGVCDAGDTNTDSDGDGVDDATDPEPGNAFICGDSDGDTCDDCAVAGTFAPTNDGTDTDSDGLCDAGDPDDDNDTILDGADPAPLDAFICGDSDGDTCDDCAVAGTFAPTNDGTDTDSDGLCDAGDPDDDNDTILDGADPAPLDAFICGDSDGDTCDDCAVAGTFAPTNDGTDTDSDGLCDAGDPDDDNDTILDGADPAPLDAFICGDSDGDTCDDCAVAGTFAPTSDGTDTDSDGLCDAGDPDDDNDTILDGADPAPLDAFICGDSDGDTCDDCAVAGTFAPTNDGTDTDSDGLCDAGDTDDDNDTILDGADPAPLDPFICGDSDGDTCDDCSSGTSNPAADGFDADGDGLCDLGDPDDDNDGRLDGDDSAPLDPNVCADTDSDNCDDCSSGTFDPQNDGPDSNMDGICDLQGPDSDGDGRIDSEDSDPGNPNVCADTDGDGCDDCTSGTFAPSIDGDDFDGDGLCNLGDLDDDNDGIEDTLDTVPLNQFQCADVDSDGCDDCVTGTFAQDNDGPDLDGDGLCDFGDPDVDGDGIENGGDDFPLDPNACGDGDGDGCDDCSSGVFDPMDDGPDLDMDGICDAGDDDRDGDTIPNDVDAAPDDPFFCGVDGDFDTCDDCTSGTFDPSNDGIDLDSDGICDVGVDTDNDGVPDGFDADPDDPFVCTDEDQDGCDDCSSGMLDAANDGDDFDSDGICNLGDTDDDNDGIDDISDSDILDPNVCSDTDGDGCDDCSSGFFDVTDDGLDTDLDGLCDLGDTDDDNDGVPDAADPSPLDAFICGDSDLDGCDDCAVLGSSDPANDGPDNDFDGLCNFGDPDDDNDGTLDGADGCPLDPDKIDEGICGCGVPDLDLDNNQIIDCLEESEFRRGDVNVDSQVDLADAIALLAGLFTQGTTFLCADAGDANDDEIADISDAIYMITYFFSDGDAPVFPFPDCGFDPTDPGGEMLDCDDYPANCL